MPPPPRRAFSTFAELTQDPWSVLLPPDADAALLLAAREGAWSLGAWTAASWTPCAVGGSTTQRRGFSIWRTDWQSGRLAMLDNWRSQLTGTAFGITRPYSEDTDYARAMRPRPEKLVEVIAIVDDETRPFSS